MYDSSKAIKELDYLVPPVEDGIRDALQWYRSNGFKI
jgi:nucleoside-diphosphate-sugar epimerase